MEKFANIWLNVFTKEIVEMISWGVLGFVVFMTLPTLYCMLIASFGG